MRRPPIPLRIYLLLLVLGAMLPGAVLTAILVAQTFGGNRAVVERRLMDAARVDAAAVDRELDAVIGPLQVLATSPARNEYEMAMQAWQLRDAGAKAVLIKGGHGEGPTATDILFDGTEPVSFEAPRANTRNTHGTGCTLSAAIAALLAAGRPLPAAAREAKAWLTQALIAADSLRLGHGIGPVHHFHALWPRAGHG